jgi:hypothetical protein
VFTRVHFLAAACACSVLLFVAGNAAAGDASRGRDLYEQRCGACHSESVHSRTKRVARNFDEIRAFVQRWSTSLELGWSSEEVGDVTIYLNNTYYRFTLPARARW